MIGSYSNLRPIDFAEDRSPGFLRSAGSYLLWLAAILTGEVVLFLGLNSGLATRVQDPTVYAWALLAIANFTLWIVVLALSLKDS
jgi:hypothetical protein